MLAGIELIHMIRKGQFTLESAEAMSFADQFLRRLESTVRVEGCSTVPGQSCGLIINATEPTKAILFV
jgi:hypothetical protein